jgi:hypothetical protein
MQTIPKALTEWHEVARSRDPARLQSLLAEDVVFESPVVFSAQRGKAITTKYLAAALKVFGEEFRYVEQWINPTSGVLEFNAAIDRIEVNGVDIIGWDADDRIIRFKVMVRPLKGIDALRAKMAAELGVPGAS